MGRRFFNTAGPCDPERHYMLPAAVRVEGLRRLIDQQLYGVVHAPRQAGKTTSLQALVDETLAEGTYAALLTSCEVGQKLEADLEGSIDGILANLRRRAERSLPEALQPPPVDPSQPVETRLTDLLDRWARQCPRPIVLVLDEIDALYDDALISVLRQLRTGYADRPKSFPQSIILVGLRDVRDYRLGSEGPDPRLGTSSPFNIKSDSLTLRDFNLEEVRALYEQHAQETGQHFEAEAVAHAFELTQGQPWLVNALARQVVESIAPNVGTTVQHEHVEAAKELLIRRRDTHLDSLIDRLREPRIQRVLEPILAGGFPSDDVLDDDIQFTKDLGLVSSGPRGLEIANPIYREIIPRALTAVSEEYLPLQRSRFVGPDGRLVLDHLLDGFLEFWVEHSEWMLQRQPYSEAAAQLVFMAFLQKIVNGVSLEEARAGRLASIDREFAVGSGRVDLMIRWPMASGVAQRFAIELKTWRDGSADPLQQGLEQLSGYLDRLGLETGTLVVFDQRSTAPAIHQRCLREHRKQAQRTLTVVRA